MTCARGCCETQLEHYRSVSISPAATPTRSGVRYAQTTQLEKNWNKDIPAYKRLVKGGVQPDTVDGASKLEQAVDAGAQIVDDD